MDQIFFRQPHIFFKANGSRAYKDGEASGTCDY